MWLLSVVCGPDTNVVIPLGPATEDWIPYSGAGNNHSWQLGRGGVTRSAELWCFPWQGGDRPALAWSPSLLWGAGGICQAGNFKWQKSRPLSPFASKNRNSPAFSGAGKAPAPALPSLVALVTDTEEDQGSHFHWEGFRSDGHTIKKIIHIPVALEESEQS